MSSGSKPKLVIEAEFRRHHPWRRAAAGVVQGHARGQAGERSGARDAGAAPAAAATVQRQPVRKVGREARAAANTASKDARTRRHSNKRRRGRRGVHLTHPDRVYWPDAGVTKKDLAEYYVSVWDWIRPHIVDRALSLVRAPEGVGGETFFQKHIAANVKSSPLRHAVTGKDHDVIAVENRRRSGRAGAVRRARDSRARLAARQSGNMRPHRVRSRSGRGRRLAADRRRRARDPRSACRPKSSKSFVKLSGGKGIHVVVPIDDVDWDTAKEFSGAHRRAHGRRQPEALSRQNDQGAARRPHLHRLFPQFARSDVGRALFDARARRRAGVDAGDWERLSAHDRRQRLFRCSI